MVERAQVSIKKPEAKRENKASQTQKTGSYQSISSPVDRILLLQRTIGNQAVGRLIESGALQAKLKIGRPGDIYEQGADWVAEQVMRMPEPNNNLQSALSALPVAASKPTPATPAAGLPAIHVGPTVPIVACQPAPKPKAPAKPKVPVTVDNVDKLYGSLTEDIAKQVFTAYGSPLAGNEKSLISAFDAQGLSAWIGLAIIKQESSFANRANNPSIDERNEANPFSVHFNTDLKRWPKGCGKNLLLIGDAGKEYTPGETVKKECAVKGFRLPTFAESAARAAKTIKDKGFEAYREEGGYKKDLNARLREIVSKIRLEPK